MYCLEKCFFLLLSFNKASSFLFRSHVCKGVRKVAVFASHNNMNALFCMVLLAGALKVGPLYLRNCFQENLLKDT